MKDRFGRNIDYMRISVTDRCSLRCGYCMPDGCEKVPMSRILTYEDIERICRTAARLGIRKLKVTGGEPFVRLGCTDLIRRLKLVEGIDEVTVTTNGQNLDRYIDELKAADIDGINISLDSLDRERYAEITGGGILDRTLQAVSLSVSAGIRTKINCVLQKDINEDELLPLAEFAFRKGIFVRFIELMPVGIADPSRGISNAIVFAKLMERWPDLAPDNRTHGNGPAVYFSRPAARGGIGLISPMHGSFCAACNKIRLTSQGKIKPCLCYEDEIDLKPYLAKTDEALTAALENAILRKPKAHCFTTERFGSKEHRLMSRIGG